MKKKPCICIIFNIKTICARPSVHLSAWDKSYLNAESNTLDIECFEYLLHTESFEYIFLNVSITPLKKGMNSVSWQNRLQQHTGHTHWSYTAEKTPQWIYLCLKKEEVHGHH